MPQQVEDKEREQYMEVLVNTSSWTTCSKGEWRTIAWKKAHVGGIQPEPQDPLHTFPQQLKVHDKEMKNVSQATYLGDVISETGTIDETIIQRGQKATGIISQISSKWES